MAVEHVTLNLEQLALYVAEKQGLIQKYKGINYGHAISLINNIGQFQDPESLFTRMRTFSASLIPSLVKNKHLVQAPFKEGKLVYVGKEILAYYYFSLLKDEFEYKNQNTKKVLDFLNDEGSATRLKIIEHFGLSKDEVMDILAELRTNFQVFMFYDGTNWTIYSTNLIIDSDTMSKSLAVTELILRTIMSFGPITVPQITNMLKLSGGRVSTSIIELYENKKIIRGHFIENSSYEAFLSSDELDYLQNFLEHDSQDKKKEITIIPSNDPYAEYWGSADFMLLEDIQKDLVIVSGKPVCSFDYKIKGDNLHIINLRKTNEYSNLEEEIRRNIQGFSENKGKILVFPQLQSELIEKQSVEIANIMTQRGYSKRSAGLVYHISRLSGTETSQNLISWNQIFPYLLTSQFLQKKRQYDNKAEILHGLSSLGIPLPLNSLMIRVRQGRQQMINQMIIDRQIVIGKFGAFTRGYITAEDYLTYSKLSPSRHLGVLEERILNLVKQKEKVSFEQLRKSLKLSDRVLLSALLRLENAHEIIQSKSISNQAIWLSKSKFLRNIKVKRIDTQKQAWVEIINRILSTNLPLTINQIANITGLSNTQVEVYLKELIASKGVRSGRFIEEEKDVQFTSKDVEKSTVAFIYQKEDIDQVIMTYLPRNDPLLILYRNFLLKRFKIRQFFLKSLPTDFAELILLNGEPAAALHFKKQEKVTYVNNIEILPEFNDSHTLMFIFSAIQEYVTQTKEEAQRKIRIKQINGTALYSEAGRKYVSLLKDMNLDFSVLP
ncbi:MAG: hypothetical protein V3V41_05940 [Candidatus Heimdallarchaeota archaeon]